MKSYILVIFLFLYSGCSIKRSDIRPSWTKDVPAPNQSLAIVKMQQGHSLNMQKRVALLQAKAELSKQKQLQIYSDLLISSQCKNKECQKNIHALSIQQSKNYLYGVHEVESFLDQSDGTYYLLIEIKP